MKFKMLGAIVMAAVLAAPAIADDADDAQSKKKKGQNRGRSAAAQIIKQLESVNLTEDQTAKIKELGKAADASMKTLREEAGLTPELMKKRMEAQKSVRESGKKGKEAAAAVNEAAGMTTEQSDAFTKMNEARTKFQKSVVALLTDEQKEDLPKAMLRTDKPAGEKGKKNKKKDAA
ncbi:MAG: Spy/CpxP family protein refolding chaperone [Rubripirellula sp.]